MRAFLLAMALGAVSTMEAQAPLPTTPAAPKAARSRFELRLSGFMISGDRSMEFANVVTNEAGSIQGVDFLARGTGVGIAVRSLTGTFGKQPNITSADVRLLLFPQVFSVFVGGGRRALWSDLNATSPSQFDIGIAGVSSTVAIGGSGLRTNITGAYYIPSGKTKDKIKSGMEGEASILYAFPRPIPLFLQVGYRTELFTAKAGTRETPEEVRGVKIGGGLLLGGR